MKQSLQRRIEKLEQVQRSTSAKMRCDACRFWRFTEGSNVVEGVDAGECRVNAPILVEGQLPSHFSGGWPDNGSDHSQLFRVFPLTCKEDWCGNWEAKK